MRVGLARVGAAGGSRPRPAVRRPPGSPSAVGRRRLRGRAVRPARPRSAVPVRAGAGRPRRACDPRSAIQLFSQHQYDVFPARPWSWVLRAWRDVEYVSARALPNPRTDRLTGVADRVPARGRGSGQRPARGGASSSRATMCHSPTRCSRRSRLAARSSTWPKRSISTRPECGAGQWLPSSRGSDRFRSNVRSPARRRHRSNCVSICSTRAARSGSIPKAPAPATAGSTSSARASPVSPCEPARLSSPSDWSAPIDVLPPGSRRWHRQPVAVRFGAPLDFSGRPEDERSARKLREITEEIRIGRPGALRSGVRRLLLAQQRSSALAQLIACSA